MQSTGLFSGRSNPPQICLKSCGFPGERRCTSNLRFELSAVFRKAENLETQRVSNLKSARKPFLLYAPRLSLRSVAGFACDLPVGLRLQAQSALRTLLVDRLPAAKKAPPAAYMPPRTIKDRGRSAPDTSR